MPRQRKRERELDELARLYDSLGPDLYRYAMVLVRNRAEAEDVVQQVFTALLAGRPRLQSIERYLFSAVRNECLEANEHRSRFPAAPGDFELETLPGVAENADERMAVERLLADLPLAQREVVYFKVFTGRTFEEIAELLDEKASTIWARYRYAMAKMREQFGEHR